MRANCNKCGKGLPRIQYIYPITHPKGQVDARPALCKACWEELLS